MIDTIMLNLAGIMLILLALMGIGGILAMSYLGLVEIYNYFKSYVKTK